MKTSISTVDVLNRIKLAYELKSDADLARFLEVKPATLSNWKARNSIDYDLVFSKCVQSDLDWLLTGRGSMHKTEPLVAPHSKDTQTKVAQATPSPDGIPLIPLDAVAGFCNGDPAQVMEYECEKYVIPSFRGAEFLIQVKGSSMYPKYSSGDIVACKCLPLDTFFQWNKVYVIDSEQGVLIKRVKKGSDDDHIILASENERYDPFPLHRSKIRSLAIVIGVIRLE